MKFLVDEDVFVCLKFMLDEWGHDAEAVELSELDGSEDTDVLARAAGDGQVIITFNREDYEALHAQYRQSGRHHPGIIICRELQGYRNFGRLLRLMRNMLETVPPEQFENTVRYLHTFG